MRLRLSIDFKTQCTRQIIYHFSPLRITCNCFLARSFHIFGTAMHCQLQLATTLSHKACICHKIYCISTYNEFCKYDQALFFFLIFQVGPGDIFDSNQCGVLPLYIKYSLWVYLMYSNSCGFLPLYMKWLRPYICIVILLRVQSYVLH